MSKTDDFLDFAASCAMMRITAELPQMGPADRQSTLVAVRENLAETDPDKFTVLELRDMCADLVEDWLENEEDKAESWVE